VDEALVGSAHDVHAPRPRGHVMRGRGRGRSCLSAPCFSGGPEAPRLPLPYWTGLDWTVQDGGGQPRHVPLRPVAGVPERGRRACTVRYCTVTVHTVHVPSR
jgi:hypothetical protein